MHDYVELHCHSYFSLLDGAASPEALVREAQQLGMPALALTDHDNLYGVVRFVQAARNAGIQPILGAEVTLEAGSHLTLLVENETGWRNLCTLISLAQAASLKGEASLPLQALEDRTGGLLALSGCRRGMLGTALSKGDPAGALQAGRWLLDQFGHGNVWIELQHHLREEDTQHVRGALEVANRLRLPVVATNNIHYDTPDRRRLQDVLVCIRQGITLDESHPLRRSNAEYHLKPGKELARLFREAPQAITNTLAIAERCGFDLPMGLQELPLFPLPEGLDGSTYLRRLCERAVPGRYGQPSAQVWHQLRHELGVIERNGLVNYFLIVWDVMDFARGRGILCQGRGSACNSLVAYLLGISPVDPLAHHLVFERFLSDERGQVVPDIDIDFQASRREEVIQYVYARYGADHVAMACTFSTYGIRSALRDVGKVLGIPARMLEQATRTLDWFNAGAVEHSEPLRALAEKEPIWQQLLSLSGEIAGLPRHLGLHNGGMVLTRKPIATRVPTEPAAMPNRVVVQWDKDAIEEAGLIKLDILGLRMLSAISDAVAIVNATAQRPLDLFGLAFEDPEVYGMLTRADTVGVFQTESGAQMNVLPRLKPRCFNDLVVCISLIRPGPLQGQMVHPYLRRRSGEEAVTYPHPRLESILRDTLGIVLGREQVLQVATALAGFTGGQGEQLRRALGKKHAVEEVERFRSAFLHGAAEREVRREIAGTVWDQLKAFGHYSFARSHAAAFAVLVYWSAYLKHYHPAAFAAGLLNNQPMGFWSSEVIVNDAKHHGVKVLPPSVNRSEGRCTVVEGALQIGLSSIDGLSETSGQGIVAARGRRPFRNLLNFCQRTRLPRRLVEHCIRAGAMDAWRLPRRQLLWDLGTLHYHEDQFDLQFPTEAVELPPLSAVETLLWEREITGLTVGKHLLSYYRSWLSQQGIVDSQVLKLARTGEVLKVAGKVERHQAPPTARGVHFITLRDEHGFLNLVVKPEVYHAYKHVWRQSPLLIVCGVVQCRDRTTNLLARWTAPLRTQ